MMHKKKLNIWRIALLLTAMALSWVLVLLVVFFFYLNEKRYDR